MHPDQTNRAHNLLPVINRMEAPVLIASNLLLVILEIMVSLSVPSSSSEVCSTPGCIQSALNVLADVDLNVDPCSDFYQYTCKADLKW